MNWWIGCSGFSYYSWKEKFYPSSVPQKFWLEYYCQFFNTVELNVTFYRTPSLGTFKDWKVRSPDGFQFTVKAPRSITHFKKFQSARDEVLQFYDRVLTGLEEKLGSVLFQLNPQMEYSEETLDRIIKSLDPSFKNVIEFRHPSWWSDEARKKLSGNKITFCSISYPGLPDDVQVTSNVLYYRFHGVPRLYRSLYSEQDLRKVADAISSEKNAEEIYIYFNNDNDAHAIVNALELQDIVKTPEDKRS